MRISDWSADVCSSDLPNDPTVVELTQNPGLSLSKRATGEGPYAVGQYINYEFIVTNTGNVTLTDVVVTDGNATIVSGSPVAILPQIGRATGRASVCKSVEISVVGGSLKKKKNK